MSNYTCSLFAALALLVPGGLFGQASPDLVLYNGKVFTSNLDSPFVEALAIRGDKILAIGRNDEIRALAGTATTRIDLGGRVVIPGFNDGHIHWDPFPAFTNLTGGGDRPLDAVLADLASTVRRAPGGGWIRGSIGEMVLSDTRTNRFALDAVAPNNPVWLLGPHPGVFNTAALRAMGIGEEQADPAGGWYGRMAGTRTLNGAAYGAAQFGACMGRDVSDDTASVLARGFMNEAVRFGITSLTQVSFTSPARMVRILQKAESLVRWRVALNPESQQTCPDASPRPARNPLPLVTIDAVKYLLDGTPIERGAFMREPYADRADWKGLCYLCGDEVRSRLAQAVSTGEQVLIHGADGSLDTVFAAMSELAPPETWRRLRVRIEHALFPEFQARALSMGVISTVTPVFFNSNPVVLQRWGPERNRLQGPLRSLLRAGVAVSIGSDGVWNPFFNIGTMVTYPRNPAEAISREEALLAYTRGGAFAELAEREKGTLGPGMLADLAVLSQDMFTATIPSPQFGQIRSVLTMVAGKIVWDSGAVTFDTPSLPAPLSSLSAASFAAPVAPGSIASAFSSQMAATPQAAVSVTVRDSAGTERPAALLYTGSRQVNYVVPEGTRAGSATVTVNRSGTAVATGAVEVAAVAPGIFTANADGRGVPAAFALRGAAGAQTSQAVFQCDAVATGLVLACVPATIDLGAATGEVVLQLFGTGIRGRGAASAVRATIGGQDAPVLAAEPQAGMAGLDQVSVRLPRSLAGRGEVDMVLTVDGKTANTVKVNIR